MQVSHVDRRASSLVSANRISRTRALPDKAEDDPDRWLWTATIITADAAGPAGDVHDRTPLILPADRVDAWLDPTLTDPNKIKKVLDGIQLEPLDVRPVSTAVNRVGTNGPQLIDRLDESADCS